MNRKTAVVALLCFALLTAWHWFFIFPFGLTLLSWLGSQREEKDQQQSKKCCPECGSRCFLGEPISGGSNFGPLGLLFPAVSLTYLCRCQNCGHLWTQ